MLSLLADGKVRLYARVADSFWSLDEAGKFVAADPPEAYYQMASETVPPEMRRSLSAPGAVTWGVTLPRDTVMQLQALMQRHAAGRLLIQGGGEVSLE